MKLFHTEKGKEVVYVQMQDLMYLNSSDMAIPAFIITKALAGIVIVDDSNRFDFVRFEEEDEVKFFKELEFIIDYGQYKDLTDEQLEEEAQKLAARANKIAEEWNGMTVETRKKNGTLFDERQNLNYMIFFLTEIYAVKHGERRIPFPSFVTQK